MLMLLCYATSAYAMPAIRRYDDMLMRFADAADIIAA